MFSRGDPDAEIYLFGSRTNDQAKGGDIDILVLSQRLTFKDQIKIKARIFKSLEEQAIHLVIARDMTDPFVRVALNEGVPL
jgi:predicted nucleotidyltransferase